MGRGDMPGTRLLRSGQRFPATTDPRVERSRQAILAAVQDILTEVGVSGVTVDAVTARSGVARSTLYRHFATTTEVIAAAFDQRLPPPVSVHAGTTLHDKLAQMLQEAQALSCAPLVPSVLAWFSVSYEAAASASDVATSHPNMKQLKGDIVDRHRQPFVDVLREAVSGGELRADLDIEVAVAELLGPLVFVTLAKSGPLTETFCTQIVDDFLRAHS